MPRVAFRLRIKAGKEREYDAAHRNVWPALLTKLRPPGALDQDPTNLQWQKEMALLFEPVPGLKPGEICDDGRSVLLE
jgi:hypothetical protein